MLSEKLSYGIVSHTKKVNWSLKITANIFFELQFIPFIALLILSNLLKGNARVYFLICLSLIFYAKFAGLEPLILLSVLAVSTWVALKKSFLLIPAVCLILALLTYWKIGLSRENTSVILPLGFSFFTFEFLHLLFEKKQRRLHHITLKEYILFSFYFPTVIAGPIKRFEQFKNQINGVDSQVFSSSLLIGLKYFSLGVIYKYFGDIFHVFQSRMYPDLEYKSVIFYFTFVVAMSMRIFLDFAGYSLIAIGLSKIAGIEIPANFRAPYLSKNVSEFWTRWHISLSSWVRDYIYIVLGGSRVNPLRTLLNLIATMTIIGLWHGVGLNYILWGLWHGIGLVVFHQKQRWLPNGLFKGKYKWISVISSMSLTFFFVSFGWLFFFYETDVAFNLFKIFFAKIS